MSAILKPPRNSSPQVPSSCFKSSRIYVLSIENDLAPLNDKIEMEVQFGYYGDQQAFTPLEDPAEWGSSGERIRH